MVPAALVKHSITPLRPQQLSKRRHAGRPVTTCLQAQGHPLRVGYFKASSEAARHVYSRVPDIVVLATVLLQKSLVK
jgi:hypothetical protein